MAGHDASDAKRHGPLCLFTTRNKKIPREALQNKVIFHVNKDVKITYTGVELRADDDELVWQQVLEYAKRTPIGEPITFTFYELCGLGWSINGRYYTKAEECLSRLQATAMDYVRPRWAPESVSLLHASASGPWQENVRCRV